MERALSPYPMRSPRKTAEAADVCRHTKINSMNAGQPESTCIGKRRLIPMTPCTPSQTSTSPLLEITRLRSVFPGRTDEQIRESVRTWSTATRVRQGLPPTITNPTALAAIATILAAAGPA